MNRAILLLCSAVFFYGCSDNIQNENYIDCPEEKGEFCISVYDPVCGEDGVTYGNSCVACQSVDRYKEGEC